MKHIIPKCSRVTLQDNNKLELVEIKWKKKNLRVLVFKMTWSLFSLLHSYL